MNRSKSIVAALLLLAGMGALAQTPAKAPAQPTPPPDPWAAVRFLVGSWEAKATGGAALAQAVGAYSFRFELHEHLLARHATSGACTAPDDFDCRHADLLFVYPEGQALKAIYFDNEGHVLHYDVSVPQPGAAVLVTDASQPGPQYRLTYTLAAGVMTGKFEIRMAGQADFATYLEWSGKAH
ncbi:MAG: hypothetical protein WCE75_01665 [Terracidiphilus sp.]